MDKIKILYTIPNFDTAGSGKALLKIAGMLPMHFEPHIACLHTKGPFFEVVKASGIPVHVLPYTVPIKPRLTLPFRVSPLRKLIKNENIHLVHSFHYSDDYSEGLACRITGVPWIFTKKNMSWGNNSWKLRSWMAKHIICQNTDMLKLFYPGSKKTSLIPRGVDMQEFCPRTPSLSLRDEFQINAQHLVILAVANLVPVKGMEFLLDAFISLRPKYPHLRLFMVGDDRDPYAEKLKHKANSSSENEYIIFTGKRPDIKDFQSIAQIFVLPTLNKGRQEGSPVSLLEAMACGTPVIASDVAGIRDQMATFPEFLFQPGNSEDLALRLEKLILMSEDERKIYGNNLVKRVENEYTLEKEVSRHVHVYQKILGLI